MPGERWSAAANLGGLRNAYTELGPVAAGAMLADLAHLRSLQKRIDEAFDLLDRVEARVRNAHTRTWLDVIGVRAAVDFARGTPPPHAALGGAAPYSPSPGRFTDPADHRVPGHLCFPVLDDHGCCT